MRPAGMRYFPTGRMIVLILMLATNGVAFAAASRTPHKIFFNHSFAVLDAETADAIEHSDYL